ncbi:MAG: ribonuclease HII [Candidatus Binataceae bacterium]
MTKAPDRRYERKLWLEGLEAVAGVDEAGVGPMAGPVVAAAVIFAPDVFIKGVHDSKQLRAEKREELFPIIQERALSIGVGAAEVDEIDRLNIYHATAAALIRAIQALAVAPQHVLVDGRRIAGLAIPQTPIVGGDRKSFCIAAASIIAKVTRDRLMREYDATYPDYGFARHKGYCTADHVAAIERFGPSPIHRTSFAPVAMAAQLRLKL